MRINYRKRKKAEEKARWDEAVRLQLEAWLNSPVYKAILKKWTDILQKDIDRKLK